jgi:hypothetical protein
LIADPEEPVMTKTVTRYGHQLTPRMRLVGTDGTAAPIDSITDISDHTRAVRIGAESFTVRKSETYEVEVVTRSRGPIDQATALPWWV